jgi:hypothetical protein
MELNTWMLLQESRHLYGFVNGKSVEDDMYLLAGLGT